MGEGEVHEGNSTPGRTQSLSKGNRVGKSPRSNSASNFTTPLRKILLLEKMMNSALRAKQNRASSIHFIRFLLGF